MAVTRSSNVSGIIANPSDISKVATITGVDAKTTATHSLYTVPTGNSLIVTDVIIRCTAANTVGGAASASFGANSTDFDNWSGIASIVVDAAGKSKLLNAVSATSIPVYAAASVFSMKITTGATATSQAIAVDVFGYLI